MHPLHKIKFISVNLLLACSLSACMSDSGSSSTEQVRLQAVDGYIVGAQVYCDEVASGSTKAGGEFYCPASTSLATVRGGFDVGFNETATENGIPFVGELRGPAHLGYVTPLSTVAVLMSSDESGYNPNLWSESVESLASVLNQSSLDLSADAASTLQLIKLNASIHQMVNGFAGNIDEYRGVSESLAALLNERAVNGQSLPLSFDVESSMIALNEQLLVHRPNLYLQSAEISAIATTVQATNNQIDQSKSPQEVATAAKQASSAELNGSLTLDRRSTLISLGDYWYGDFQTVSIDDFEDPTRVNGVHHTHFNRYLGYIRINQRSIGVDADLVDAKVSLAMSIRSTSLGDSRAFNLLSHDVYLSARKGDSSSLSLEFPEDALVYASGVSQHGVYTETSIELDKEKIFSSTGGLIDVSIWQARDELAKLGYDDIMAFSGDYEVTFVIGGLKIIEIDKQDRSFAKQYTVEAGNQAVSGSGFKGYISYNGS
jgi:hypothetical protein